MTTSNIERPSLFKTDRRDLIERIRKEILSYTEGDGNWDESATLYHCTTLTLLEDALHALETQETQR